MRVAHRHTVAYMHVPDRVACSPSVPSPVLCLTAARQIFIRSTCRSRIHTAYVAYVLSNAVRKSSSACAHGSTVAARGCSGMMLMHRSALTARSQRSHKLVSSL